MPSFESLACPGNSAVDDQCRAHDVVARTRGEGVGVRKTRALRRRRHEGVPSLTGQRLIALERRAAPQAIIAKSREIASQNSFSIPTSQKVFDP